MSSDFQTVEAAQFTLSPFSITLAQDGVPKGVKNEATTSAGTTASGSTTGANSGAGTDGAAARPQGFGIELLLFGAVILFVIMTVLGGRREKKKYEAMLSSIKKNDSVRTVGGIIGSVVEVKPDVIVLKVDENSNTKLTVARSKIEAVLKESTAS